MVEKVKGQLETDLPVRYDSDRKQALAALEELRKFRDRQDVPPQYSTLDANLKRAIEHLEDIEDSRNSMP